jgi:hypothetical protein
VIAEEFVSEYFKTLSLPPVKQTKYGHAVDFEINSFLKVLK